MADLTNSDVTITLNARDRHVLGKLRMSQGSLAFGDGALTYPYGGVPMPAIGNFGMNKEVSMLGIVDASGDGLIYRYDQANRKVKIFTSAPPIVYEEVVTVTGNVGYLKYPAAHIEYVTDDTDDYRVIPGGLTPIAKSVSVDMGFSLTTGVLTRGQRTKLTFLTADTVTSCKVSYITQAWKEVADNMVQACITAGTRVYGHADMSFTAGTPDVIKLGEDYVAMQSVCWDAVGTYTPMSALQDDATLTAASTECVLDFRKSSTFGEASFHQTDAVDTAGHSVYFNYIKDPGAGFFLYNRFTNAAIDDSADTLSFTDFPLIGCTCGGIPMELTTKKCLMTGVNDTLAAGEGKFTSHAFLLGVAPAHQHAAITAGTPAGSVAAPTFTGSQLATHQHAAVTAGTPAGSNSAPAFTPSAGSRSAVISASLLGASAVVSDGNADQGADRVNGNYISTYALTSGIADGDNLSLAKQTDVPRGIMVGFYNDSGGPLDLFEGDAVFIVTGTFRGAAQVDTITYTSTAGNKSIANTKYRYEFGVKPFDTITTIELDAGTPNNAIKVGAGLSPLIGILNALETPAEADIKSIQINRAVVAVAGTYSGANQTINIGVFADDNIGTIVLKEAVACIAGSVAAPTFTGSQLSTHQHDAVTAGTPAGSNSAPAFTGSAMSTHQHASAMIAPVITMHSATDDDSMPAWIAGDPSEIQTIPIEISEDTLIQATTLKFSAWGK